MVEKKKTYIGTYKTEEEAAKVYDKFSILLNGIDAKTNFVYRKNDVEQILRLSNLH
jgi:hypothetical protein